ncbi:MAG TPA: dienelactone hydrolase family protein [Prosthecobacter sp.]
MFRPFLTLALMALASLPAVSNAELTPQSFEGTVSLKVGYKYLLSLPDGYEADSSKKWPLLVFLHGAGERGNNLELLKKHGPPKLIAAGKKFEAIVVCPQVPLKNIWNEHGVKALTDEIVRSYRVDTSRLYLTGISMGGFGTWDTALAYPDTYAAIAPICGGAGVGFVMADRIKDLPCWIFHGDKDPAVSVDFSKKIYDALKKAGSKAKLTLYPGVAHDSWTQTYDNPEFWDWLFAQKKP